MTQIQISLFGGIKLEKADGLPLVIKGIKEQALLAYLVVEAGQTHSRLKLAGLLWGEMSEQDARNNLRVTLSRIKRSLGKTEIPYLLTDWYTVGVHPDATYGLDVAICWQLLAESEGHVHKSRAGCQECRHLLHQATQLYHAPFLDGFFLNDAPQFEEWLFVQRERLHVQMMEALDDLGAGFFEEGQFAEAKRYARRQLELDPLYEKAYRQLMAIAGKIGQRGEAIKVYEECRQLLQQQLGVPPDPETTALYQKLTEPQSSPLPHPPASQPPHNLPSNKTPFMGREAELKLLTQRLQTGDYRLLTLVGEGGIGKTRLAIQAAHAVLPHYADGAFFVALAGVSRPSLMPTAFATAMGLSLASSAEEPQAQVLAHLKPRQILLVLDNLEHLLHDIELILAILEEAPRVTLLVTSRERVHVQVEDVFRLQGLPVPPKNDNHNVNQFASVRLFADRAFRLLKSFQLDEVTTEAVVTICRLTEGLPLAIELAAGLVVDWEMPALATALAQNIALYHTSQRDVPSRHRSVQAVFEYSWALLAIHEQAVLMALSVFAGTFTLEAAKNITQADKTALNRLVFKSLLRQQADNQFDIHPLIRQLAKTRLQDMGDATSIRNRHSHYYLGWLAGHYAALVGRHANQTNQTIQAALDDVRLAWDWGVKQGIRGDLEGVLPAFFQFYFQAGLYHEAIAVFEVGVACLAGNLLPQLHNYLSQLYSRTNDFNAGIQHAQTAIALVKENATEAGWGHLLWGYALAELGELETASYHYQLGLQIAQQTKSQQLEAQSLRYLGMFHRDQGQFDQVEIYLQSALAIQQELGNFVEEQALLLFLAINVLEQARYDEAQLRLQAIIASVKSSGDRGTESRMENALGYVTALLGDFETARFHHEQSRRIAQEIGDVGQMSHALHNLSAIERKMGRLVEAEHFAREALASGKQLASNDAINYAWQHLGYVQAAQGAWSAASAAFAFAKQGWEAQGMPSLVMETNAGMAEMAWRLDESTRALGFVEEIFAFLADNKLEGVDELGQIYLSCCRVLAGEGDARVAKMWEMGMERLREIAGNIQDEGRRKMFWEKVPANKALLNFKAN